MRLPATLFTVLLSLLVFTSECTLHGHEQVSQWPYNLPEHVKHFPEDEALVRRETMAQARLKRQPAQGVKKMSFDEGEKFFLDYWSFENGLNYSSTEIEGGKNVSATSDTGKAALPLLQPAFPIHLTYSYQQKRAVLPRLIQPFGTAALFVKRDYTCPSGTSNCASIDRPNSCCPTGEVCQLVQGNAPGDVGCCADGQTCSGSVLQCQDGYSSCPNESGGGCCVPGYQCDSIGCMWLLS